MRNKRSWIGMTEQLYALIWSLPKCILDNYWSELVCRNLYACLINYLHLVSANDGCHDVEAAVNTFGRRSMALSVPPLSSRDDMSLMES